MGWVMVGRLLKLKILFVAVFLPLVVHAANPAVLLVVDSSGSMWGRIEGTEKVYLVRDALVKFISGFPQDTGIGLIAYGHKQKGNCNGSELLAPIGSPRDLIINRVSSFTPKGRAPIGLSVASAIRQIKQRGGGGTIVLLSDGGDSCKGDPCRSALSAGKNIRIHVLGLGLKARDIPKLSCIAKNGGGRLFTVNSKASLFASLDTLKKEISIAYLDQQNSGPGPEKNTAIEESGGAIAQGSQDHIQSGLPVVAEQGSVEQKTADQKLLTDKTAAEKAAAEKAAAEKAAAEKAAAEKAAAEKAAAEKAAAEKAAAEKAAAEQAAAEKAAAEKAAAEKAAAEKAAAEKVAAERRAAAEKAAAERRAAAEKAAAERRAAAEKAAAERRAAAEKAAAEKRAAAEKKAAAERAEAERIASFSDMWDREDNQKQPGVIFSDDFSSGYLSDHWTVLNPSTELLNSNGEQLVLVTRRSSLAKGDVPNLLILDHEDIDGDYSVSVDLESVFSTGKTGKTRQKTGLLFYRDNKNYLGLILSNVGVDTFPKCRGRGCRQVVQVELVKVLNGSETRIGTPFRVAWQPPGTTSLHTHFFVHLKVDKIGFIYSAYVSLDGEWYGIGAVPFYGSRLNPAIFASSNMDYPYAQVGFDDVVIRELRVE